MSSYILEVRSALDDNDKDTADETQQADRYAHPGENHGKVLVPTEFRRGTCPISKTTLKL